MEQEEYEEIYEEAYKMFQNYEKSRGSVFTNEVRLQDYMDYWIAVAAKKKYCIDRGS